MSKVAKKTASKTNLAFSGVTRRRSAAVAPMRLKKGQVFLSYNSADKLVATQVAEKLAASGYRIANGEDVVGPGENWLTAVGEALNRSDAVVFFLSDASRFVTGQVLCVDGGWCVSEGQYSE